VHCPPSLLHPLSMRLSANAGHWLRRFNQHGGRFQSQYLRQDRDKCLQYSRSVCDEGFFSVQDCRNFYLGVYWNVELCRVTQEDKNSFSNSFKQPQTDRDSCALTTVWKVTTARKLFTMFFTLADHVGNLHQGCNYVCYYRALNLSS